MQINISIVQADNLKDFVSMCTGTIQFILPAELKERGITKEQRDAGDWAMRYNVTTYRVIWKDNR